MINFENKQFEKEDNFIHTIKLALESIAVYKGMLSMLVKYEDNSPFITLLNNTGMIATIRLSNIFGTDSEDNHYKTIFHEDCESFKEQVILKCFDNMADYTDFHFNLKKFRNNYIVHFKIGDSKYKSDEKFLSLPNFELSKKLLFKSLIYFLNYYNYENIEYIEDEINQFYDKIYQNTKKYFI